MTRAECEKIYRTIKSNPYIRASEKTDKGYRFLDRNEYTEEELDNLYKGVALEDIETGYRDRKRGFVDDWFIYNRADNGTAYTLGVERAMKDEDCVGELRVLEA